jgi:hypothetical protein
MMNSKYYRSNSQQGVVLIVFLFILVIGVTSASFAVLNSTEVKIERDKKTASALNEAKAALIGFVIKNVDISSPAYLPNPDLDISPIIPEGGESSSAGAVDITLIGKLPWVSLNIPPLKDGWGECLWYVVSGRFKKSPHTSVLNWDTQGQINVINAEGNIVASNLAALIVSPGFVLAGQDRENKPENIQCGGNYDVRNYLDTYLISNAINVEPNYFSGSTNNRQAPNTLNKNFVMTNNDFYNDQLQFITVDEILNPIIRRNDFSERIAEFLSDPYFEAVLITGSKGTNNVDCAMMLFANRAFCENWKEMILLKGGLPISLPPLMCNRVVIFGGKRAGLQTRTTAAHKNDPANYLEEPNLSAFNDVLGLDFAGNATFDYKNPSADIVKCI